MTTPPSAGWYPLPHDPAQLRYWDGAQWTEHTQPAQSATLTVAATAQRPMAPLHCRACGNQLGPTASVCPQCGTAIGTPKDKTVAILLAVFLSFWTWLYTYQRDAWKFWTGLGLTVLGFFLAFLLIGFLVFPAIWIWSVIDVAVKDDRFYQRYPNA